MSSSQSAPSLHVRQQNPRGTGKRGASKGRGGSRRGGKQNTQPPPKPVESPEPIQEGVKEPETQYTAVEPSESGDLEVCWICAEPVKYYSVSECNHRTCHVCALRLRALYKRNDCAFCKENQETVVFTTSLEAPYESLSVDSIPFKDPKLAIAFETQDIMEDTLILLRFNCPDSACDYIGNGWGDLKLHVRATHGKLLCDLCIRFKKVFAHEHALYPPSVLPLHLPSMHQRAGKNVSGDQVEGGVHPLCEFCKECFFSSDELYPHMRERHEECFICKRNEVRDQYFLNYDSLEKHFNNFHFPCPQKECQARKFVVFNSPLDLKAHMVEEHGGDMSARDRKDARRVQADFTFEELRPGGRRGGAAGHAVSGAGGGGAHPGSGDRRRAAFGGSLTAPQAQAQTPSRTPIASRSSTPPSDSAADPAIAERHSVFMARLESLSKNSTTAVPAVRAAARGYKTNETNARDFISTIWNVLDHNLDNTASIVNAFVDLLDEEEKKQDLLASWRGFVIEQRRQFPDLVPVAVGDGYAGITSGRVLNAKNSTSARSSQQSSRQVLDRVARVASSSSSSPTAAASSSGSGPAARVQDRFPPLSSAAASGSSTAPGVRQAQQRATPWSSATNASNSRSGSGVDVIGKPTTRPAVASVKQPPPPRFSTAQFPELPTAASSRAPRPVIGGNASLRNILGTGAAPQVSVWAGSDGGVSQEGLAFEGLGEGDVEGAPPPSPPPQKTGRKKKGKQKQTLFKLGAFPT